MARGGKQAPVDRNALARNVRGIWAREEGDQSGYLFDVAQSRRRNTGEPQLPLFVGQMGGGVRRKIARHDTIDGNAVPGDRGRKLPRESEDGRFRGGVIRLARISGSAHDRADVDDASEAPDLHGGERESSDGPGPDEIGEPCALPVCVRHLQEEPVTRDAGIVDQDRKRSQTGLCPRHQGGARLWF
jgi:hypothetical protein